MRLSLFIVALGLLAVQANLMCYKCYKKECRNSFDTDEISRNANVVQCAEGVTSCLKYFLHDQVMRLCGYPGAAWEDIPHCDAANESANICQCYTDHCNGVAEVNASEYSNSEEYNTTRLWSDNSTTNIYPTTVVSTSDTNYRSTEPNRPIREFNLWSSLKTHYLKVISYFV